MGVVLKDLTGTAPPGRLRDDGGSPSDFACARVPSVAMPRDQCRRHGVGHPVTKPETPFSRGTRLYYIVLKYGGILAAVLIALDVAYRSFRWRSAHETGLRTHHFVLGILAILVAVALAAELLPVVKQCRVNAFISSTRRCATARRPTASISRLADKLAIAEHARTSSASIMSRAAIRAPIRPTRSCSPSRAHSTPPSRRSA